MSDFADVGGRHVTTDAARRLAVRLREAGVGQDIIEVAAMAGELGLLAFDRLLMPEEPKYNRREVADRSGVTEEFAMRLWRALGFTDLSPEEPVFGDIDVEMLAIVARMVAQGIAEEHMVIQVTRVLGSSMARIAEAQIGVIESWLARAGLAGDDAIEQALVIFEHMEQDWSRVFSYAHLRHLQAAAKRSSFMQEEEQGGDTKVLAVGFADMVGFTALSQQLDAPELAAAVDRFETIAYDTIAGLGARVVKMIGDEVMFVADDAAVAAEVGLTLAESFAADEDSPADVRVGMAYGPVLPHEGDYFGPTVNLASRIVNIAYPGSVVVSDALENELDGDPGFGWKPLRLRRLKGIGIVPLWVLTRPSDGSRRAAEVARILRDRRNQILGR